VGPGVGTGEGAWAKGLFELAVPRQCFCAVHRAEGKVRTHVPLSFVGRPAGTVRFGIAKLAFGEHNTAVVELPRLAGVHTPPAA
jgi:hypothetical protein